MSLFASWIMNAQKQVEEKYPAITVNRTIRDSIQLFTLDDVDGSMACVNNLLRTLLGSAVLYKKDPHDRFLEDTIFMVMTVKRNILAHKKIMDKACDNHTKKIYERILLKNMFELIG